MAPVYDVFLSHSSADKPAVEKLAHKLLEVKINPFLDKWHLVPGKLWQVELENGLRDSGACISPDSRSQSRFRPFSSSEAGSNSPI